MKTRLTHISRTPRQTRQTRQAAAVCVFVLLSVAPALGAGRLTSVSDFNAGKARAEAELQTDKAACDKLSGNSRDICREQARGKEMVAKAELELAHTGTRQSHARVAAVKLDTAYDIARTRCNDQAGSARNVCAKEAQAARAKGQDDLKLNPRGINAARGTAGDAREATYKLAAEKCGAMAVEARAGCLATAKAKAKAGKT